MYELNSGVNKRQKRENAETAKIAVQGALLSLFSPFIEFLQITCFRLLMNFISFLPFIEFLKTTCFCLLFNLKFFWGLQKDYSQGVKGLHVRVCKQQQAIKAQQMLGQVQNPSIIKAQQWLGQVHNPSNKGPTVVRLGSKSQ